MVSRARPNVDEPVCFGDDGKRVLHHEHAVAAFPEAVKDAHERVQVARVKASGRLIEDVGDTEKFGRELRCEPQALTFAARECWGCPVEREIAEAERDHRFETCCEVVRELAGDGWVAEGARMCRGVAYLAARECCCKLLQLSERERREVGDVVPHDRDAQGLRLDARTLAVRAKHAAHELHHAPLHHLALRVREGVEHVAAGADEGAHVAGFSPLLPGFASLRWCEARIDGLGGAFFCVKNPVARLLRQLPPWNVDVDPARDEDVALVLPCPGDGPRGDSTFANREGVIRHHELLGHVEDATHAVAFRAGTFWRVWREIFRVQHRLVRRILPCSREEHADDARELRRRGDVGASTRAASSLLQRNRWWHPLEFVDVRDTSLIDEPASVRRDRFEIAPLGFRKDRAEREGRLPGAGDAGEGNDGVTWQVEIHVVQVVRTCASDSDAVCPGVRVGVFGCGGIRGHVSHDIGVGSVGGGCAGRRIGTRTRSRHTAISCRACIEDSRDGKRPIATRKELEYTVFTSNQEEA